MASDGSIIISTKLDNDKLEKEYSRIAKKVESIKDKIDQKQAERSPLAEQSRQMAAQLDAAKVRLDYMKSGNQFFSSSHIQEQATTVKALQKEWDGVQGKVERYDDAIKRSAIELERNKAKAGGIAQRLAAASRWPDMMAQATTRAEKNLDRFGHRLRSVVRSALIFTVIASALRAMREWTLKVIKTSPEAAAAIAKLKAALLTLAQPLVNVVIPAFIKFTNVLAAILMQLAKVVAFLFGSTVSQSQKSAAALQKQTAAFGATGKAAKKAGEQLAGFDELNVLGKDSDRNSEVDSIAPDFGGLEEFNTQEYKEKLDEMTLYASSALLALGTILALSGANIPLGLGLMAVGALGLAYSVKENWDLIVDKMRGPAGKITALVGGSALAIGAILAFSGAAIPLGVGLMVLGAAALGTAAALNWDKIVDASRETAGKITATVSASLLAVGAILAFSGVALPLGIALMAAGATGLATVTALNWDNIVEAVKGPTGKIIAAASGALLALGLILALSGVGLPLGIALIAAGATSLVTVGALNWGAILDKLKGVWNGIKGWWTASVAPKLTLEYWQGQFNNIKEALISKIKDAVNGGIELFNKFINWVNDKLNISWDGLTVMGKEIIPAGSFQLFTIPQIPHLAQGAVIPPNREFMAVLGDQKNGRNLEGPEKLFRQIVREEMDGFGGGGDREIVIRFEGNMARLVRELKPYIDKEHRRVGKTLIQGV